MHIVYKSESEVQQMLLFMIHLGFLSRLIFLYFLYLFYLKKNIQFQFQVTQDLIQMGTESQSWSHSAGEEKFSEHVVCTVNGFVLTEHVDQQWIRSYLHLIS